MLGSLSDRARNRSISTGRRSYSAQTRPIAPASHSRDIEARHSTCWEKSTPISDLEDSSLKSQPDPVRIGRSRSQYPKLKPLRIVELGSPPRKYSAVRNLEPSVREGKLKRSKYFRYEYHVITFQKIIL